MDFSPEKITEHRQKRTYKQKRGKHVSVDRENYDTTRHHPNYSQRGCSGTILTAINTEEFGRIILPIIRAEKQAEIEQKVTESFNLRNRAKELLECAKRAVEIAIEQDEQTAIDWLESV